MYQLVAIGDVTVDMFFQGKGLTQDKERFNLAIGGKYYVDAFHHGLGGSGANVSIHSAQLGLDCALVAPVGENAFKNLIVQTLARKTVSTEFLHFEREHLSISTILLAPSGERTIIKYSDPKQHIHLVDHALERIKRSGIVFMGNLHDVPLTERVQFMKNVRSETNLLALNLGAVDCELGVTKLAPLLAGIDILFVNRYECATLLKKSADKLDLSKNIYKDFGCEAKVIVVTDGAQGSYAYTADAVYTQSAAKVTVVDATGAGDAFTASFLVTYTSSQNIQQALADASSYAGKVVSKIGAN